ncbi:GNAT family N-acetyltransferase [Roseisalinus antarcticus]|uniref:N-acetyltransferase domain-containing protein n=1 Tax=Roseisalinus antarcticus TaxID=254357 RepID=A0A1Y5SDC8_9RHOB|nr:GNAT family N-acetyltransferase [Roseisalinus antarcticus]SLN37084.1 hypothetical protein ROA7023_01373 [Roseisalinus antarcticus]
MNLTARTAPQTSTGRAESPLRVPVLETARLRLRAPEARDLDAYVAYCASDRSATVGGPFSREEAYFRLCAIAGQWQLRGFGRWIIADRESDAALGLAGLHYPDGWPEPEIAWTVFDGAEGRGIAQEAAIAVRAHVFGTLGWSRVMSAVAPSNSRSVRLAQRLGCTLEGEFDHPVYGRLGIWRHPAPAGAPKEIVQ